MKVKSWRPLGLAGLLTISIGTQAQHQLPQTLAAGQAQIASGPLQGVALPSGIRVFRGVPYAAAPVGSLRWRAPQPVQPWAETRPATQFGPRAMQLPLFSDMLFRSNGVSEDCLYLNVWTGASTTQERRPVLVYFYGGGFQAGDGSELRYDGESLAGKGIVLVTVNYRLGVFGFLAHPALTKESGHHASGNYGLLDQAAALQWVRANIAAFGGDPQRVTVGGESAGSFSVSAQLASPLVKNLVAGAIGESGSLLSLQPLATLKQAEQEGTAFATAVGAQSLAALRALPAQQLLDVAGKPGATPFRPIVDGYFLPRQPAALYRAGRQAQVPLLVGWNSQEMNAAAVLGAGLAPTVANYQAAVAKLYPGHAAEVLRHYSAATDADVPQAATDLASDRFIAYSTWRWADAHARTSHRPVYRYLFARPRPARAATPTLPPTELGAVHSAEIEYALGNLATNQVYSWSGEDYWLSNQLQAYFVAFLKTGNPNVTGLPNWVPLLPDGTGPTLRLDATPRLTPGPDPARYELLGRLAEAK